VQPGEQRQGERTDRQVREAGRREEDGHIGQGGRPGRQVREAGRRGRGRQAGKDRQ
jgi:hypothetical protein